MERSFKRDLGVVQAIGIEFNFCAFGTASEEVDRSAFSDHFCGPDPGFGTSHGFDHYVGAASAGRKRTNCVDWILYGAEMHDIMRAHFAGSFDLRVALHDCDNVASHGLGYVHEHQADGAGPDHCDGIADLYAGFMKSAQY